jgi:mono/diheme cytochrome c family protein
MRHAALLAAFTCSLVLSHAGLSLAATAEQEEKAAAIDETLKEAGKLVAAKKYADAGPLVIKAQNDLRELAGEGAAVKPLVTKLYGKLSATHRLVAKNGVELPALEDPLAKPARTKPGAPMAGGVSFTKEVVPILVARCNNCHITGTRGGFSMENYTALMKGSESGTVFTPGTSKGSRLMDVLESGDMPRGGGPLSAEQMATIAKWIDEGAKFDGQDPNAMLVDPNATPMERPMLTVVQASGNESTRFSRDIAPVLAEQCMGCHGGRQPAAQLRLETFTAMLAGNNDGLVLTPGDASASLLIKKIKGTAGAQMPLNRPPLPPETIALFEKWVGEGAKYDGDNPTDMVDFVANVYKASQMTHEELSSYRGNLAMKNWQLGNPDTAPEQAETENFLLYGNVGQDRLTEIGQLAEQIAPKVGRIFKAPANAPLFKGRMTLFVFQKRYDYSEFGQMVERREVPDIAIGHFKFNVVDAYGCVLAPDSAEASLASPIGQQVAGAYIKSLGKVPDWFAQGVSWAAGARVDPKDPLAKKWAEAVPAVLAQSQKPDDFLTGQLNPESTALLNYSFADFLMSNPSKFNALVASLRKGAAFDQALVQVYGGTANQLALPWAAKVASSGGGKRGR